MESSPLTTLEDELVQCVGLGLSNESIARRLNLTLPALEHELATVYKKLGVVSRVELLLSICSGQVSPGRVNGKVA